MEEWLSRAGLSPSKPPPRIHTPTPAAVVSRGDGRGDGRGGGNGDGTGEAAEAGTAKEQARERDREIQGDIGRYREIQADTAKERVRPPLP